MYNEIGKQYNNCTFSIGNTKFKDIQCKIDLNRKKWQPMNEKITKTNCHASFHIFSIHYEFHYFRTNGCIN